MADGDPTLWNPGEPVFDQSTGEPFIDEFGAMVDVAPLSRVDAGDGRELDGDDVVNAAWYRANKYLGESPRDRSIGVPYLQAALGGGDVALAATSVTGEVALRTPGVAGVVGVRVEGLDPSTRVMRFSARLVRADGSGEQEFATTVVG